MRKAERREPCTELRQSLKGWGVHKDLMLEMENEEEECQQVGDQHPRVAE